MPANWFMAVLLCFRWSRRTMVALRRRPRRQRHSKCKTGPEETIATIPPNPRKATGPGVGLAYDVVAAKLADQHEYISRLNTRLGGISAVLVAATAAITLISSIPIRLVAVWML